jgi:hypothetical protein
MAGADTSGRAGGRQGKLRTRRPDQCATVLNFHNGGSAAEGRERPGSEFDIGSFARSLERPDEKGRGRLPATPPRWPFSVPARQERGGRPVDLRSDRGSELEHIHDVADRRRIRRDVRVLARLRVRQIVATAAGDRRQSPIRLDELQRRDVVGMGVVDRGRLASRPQRCFLCRGKPVDSARPSLADGSWIGPILSSRHSAARILTVEVRFTRIPEIRQQRADRPECGGSRSSRARLFAVTHAL